MAGLRRNGRPESVGIGGRIVSENAFKRGITPLQVIGHLVRLQWLIGENSLHCCF